MAESADAHGSEPYPQGRVGSTPTRGILSSRSSMDRTQVSGTCDEGSILPGGISGYSAVWLARTLNVGEAGSSNLPSPIKLMLIDGYFLLN